MTFGLHALPKTRGRRTKRVGRGHGSGRGTYAARGIKGQRARTGGRTGIIRRSLKHIVARLPKQRGFRSPYLPFRAVPLRLLERRFAAGTTVTPKDLALLGYRLNGYRGLKIVGPAVLTKKLTVHAHAFSASAEHAITKAGGRVIRLAE